MKVLRINPAVFDAIGIKGPKLSLKEIWKYC